MGFLFNLETDVFIDLINKSIEKMQESSLWEQWIVLLPNMTSEGSKFISFEKFKDMHTKKNTATDRSDEDILHDAQNIIKSMGNKAGENHARSI